MKISSESDLIFVKKSEVHELQSEIQRLKNTILWLKCGIVLLFVVGIVISWLKFNAGKRIGYDEALRDFKQVTKTYN